MAQDASIRRLAPRAAPAGPGALRIPCPATGASVRLAPLATRDRFLDPGRWQVVPMADDPAAPGWRTLDVDALGLPDGDYEYDLVLDSGAVVPDPFAEELVRFGGYRGLLRIRDGRRWRPPFTWEAELDPARPLPRNHELVVYEVPLRWMDGDDEAQVRQVGLGTFDRLLFEHLDAVEALGVNALELLPVQDSPDTLAWGYGTRFFLAPDLDMGAPVDLKLLVKACHRRGLRVILDVVMNHARGCPLAALAREWYFAPGNAQPGRNGWGGDLFWYDAPVDGAWRAREFQCAMGEHWIREFHVDGYRIDEFRGLQSWDFVQQFRERTTAAQRALFPDRPFVVIAEDSGRDAAITQDRWPSPNGRRTVDAAWSFSFQEEVRSLLTDALETRWGEPSRTDRIRAALAGTGLWDGWARALRPGFEDLAQAVTYVTSHDVERAPRFVNLVTERILARLGVLRRGWAEVRDVIDQVPADGTPGAATDAQRQAARDEALDRAAGAFALLLTSVGIPMFLAGEEFGDVHDLDETDWRLKMTDPVNFARRERAGHAALLARVKALVALRRSHPALLRNELELFWRHPRLDEPAGERVFAYCRTAGRALGSTGQVVVLVNAGPQDYPEFVFPGWPWPAVVEHGAGARGAPLRLLPGAGAMATSLAPFQVRVLTT
jgi:1,4-alpha-glucan branching enzyme